MLKKFPALAQPERSSPRLHQPPIRDSVLHTKTLFVNFSSIFALIVRSSKWSLPFTESCMYLSSLSCMLHVLSSHALSFSYSDMWRRLHMATLPTVHFALTCLSVLVPNSTLHYTHCVCGMRLRSLIWDVASREWVVWYRRFGTACFSHLCGVKIPTCTGSGRKTWRFLS